MHRLTRIVFPKSNNVTGHVNLQVNVGDLMEVYTNGLFPSTRHRVIVPEEEVVRRRAR